MATIWVKTRLPEELLEKFLQHLRDFDAAHVSRCRFEILTNTNMPNAQVREIFARVTPPLPFRVISPNAG